MTESQAPDDEAQAAVVQAEAVKEKWRKRRLVVAALLAVALVGAGFSGVMGNYSGAYYMDGGDPNSFRGPLLMAMLFLQVAFGFMLVVWCKDPSEWFISHTFLGYVLGGFDLVGTVIGVWVGLLPAALFIASGVFAIAVIALTFVASHVVFQYHKAEHARIDAQNALWRSRRQ
jgi:hypothetical protein